MTEFLIGMFALFALGCICLCFLIVVVGLFRALALMWNQSEIDDD